MSLKETLEKSFETFLVQNKELKKKKLTKIVSVVTLSLLSFVVGALIYHNKETRNALVLQEKADSEKEYNIDISNWDVSETEVLDLELMFKGIDIEIDLSNWD